MSGQIDKSIQDKFPFFGAIEQSLFEELLIKSEPNTPRFLKAKEQVLDLLYQDLVQFYRWDSSHEDRIRIRKRLLNISNLFVIIPVEELRKISDRARLTLKKIVYDIPDNPFELTRAEMHSYDVKYVDRFATFFSRILLEPNVSALDFIAGNREKRQYPRSQFTVFLKSIQDEVISKDYLTASAEPLTQTQIISLYTPDGEMRDFFTIGFDMVFESAFIDFFHTGVNVAPATLLRNAHILGKKFLTSSMDTFMQMRRSTNDFQNEFPIYPLPRIEVTNKRLAELLDFLTDNLVPQIQNKIQQWNLQLGLDADNEQIYWSGE